MKKEKTKSKGNCLPLLILAVLFFAGACPLFYFGYSYAGVGLVTLSLVFLIISLRVIVTASEEETKETKEERDKAVAELESFSDIKKERASMSERIDELTRQNEALKESAISSDAKVKKAIEDAEKRGRAALVPEDTDKKVLNIITVANKVIDDMSGFAAAAGITLQLSSSSQNISVMADEKVLSIMFRNIIDNSVKYMNTTGSLVITISSIGEDLFIVLKDNGNGLDVSEADHIFELNFQGSNRVSGNGLGLTQAKAIVESYGGTIYAKTGAKKGMAIYIQLPTTPSMED